MCNYCLFWHGSILLRVAKPCMLRNCQKRCVFFCKKFVKSLHNIKQSCIFVVDKERATRRPDERRKVKVMSKVSAREVFQSFGGWIITRVSPGYNGEVRIDAKRRYHVTGKPDFFSKWVKINYANRCRREVGLQDLEVNY